MPAVSCSSAAAAERAGRQSLSQCVCGVHSFHSDSLSISIPRNWGFLISLQNAMILHNLHNVWCQTLQYSKVRGEQGTLDEKVKVCISFSLTAAVSFFVLPVRWALLPFSGLAELQTGRKRGSIQFLQNSLNQSHSHLWSTRLVCSSTSQRGMNNISIFRCCTQQIIDGRWHEKDNNSEEAKSRVYVLSILRYKMEC